METPEDYDVEERAPARRPLVGVREGGLWTLGGRLTWVAGLVLAVSAFTGWYTGEGDFTLSVTGWHSGTLGKLVFFVGVAVVVLVALREAGIALPATLPESLVVVVLGSLATIFVIVRLVSVPEQFIPAEGRGIGLWISLVAAVAVILGGLLRASEEL